MGSCWQHPCPALTVSPGFKSFTDPSYPWTSTSLPAILPSSTSSLPDEMCISLRTGRVHSSQLLNFRHLPFSAQSASLVQSQLVRAPSQCLSGDNHLGYRRYWRPLSGQVSAAPWGSCGDRCHSSEEGC